MSDLSVDSITIYQMSTSAIRRKITRIEFLIESGQISEDEISEAEDLLEALSDELSIRAEEV